MASSWPAQRSPSKDGDFGLEDLFREQVKLEEEEEEDVEDEMGYIEPLLFDPNEHLAWVAKEAAILKEKARKAEERKRQEEEKKVREAEERKRNEKERKWRREKHDAVINSIRKFDPKSKSLVWTRFPFEEFSSFDIDEESNYPPMRNTKREYQTECSMFFSANIFTIKIVSSDVGFPINVYGKVIARDSLDNKCVYLFRCHRRDSQLIKSEDDSLILIGPARGLLLIDFIYLEVDLNIRDEQGHDKTLGSGLLQIDGRQITQLERNEVTRGTLTSWLSTVEVKYATVKKAVEATVEVHTVQGYFCGKISAHTSSTSDEIVLHESEGGGVFTSDGNTNIQLWRRVVAVCLNEKLILIVERQASNDMQIIQFSPSLNGASQHVICCADIKLCLKVTWSVIT